MHTEATCMDGQIARRGSIYLGPHMRRYTMHEARRKAEAAANNDAFRIECVHQRRQLGAERLCSGLDERLVAWRGKNLLARGLARLPGQGRTARRKLDRRCASDDGISASPTPRSPVHHEGMADPGPDRQVE